MYIYGNVTICFVLFSFLLLIAVYLYNKVNTLEKNCLENFNNNKITEGFDNNQTQQIKNIINEQYNLDIEAIRNLGLSKSSTVKTIILEEYKQEN